MTPAMYLFFYGEIESYCRWCDLQRLWMLRRQRVWGLLPYRVFIIYPDLGVDLSKLLLLESQNPNCMASDIMDNPIRLPCWLLVWKFDSKPFVFLDISSIAALAIYRTVIKSCVVCCSCVIIRCFSCCFYFSVVVVVSFFCCCCCYPPHRVMYYDVCHLYPPLCRVVMGFVV